MLTRARQERRRVKGESPKGRSKDRIVFEGLDKVLRRGRKESERRLEKSDCQIFWQENEGKKLEEGNGCD